MPFLDKIIQFLKNWFNRLTAEEKKRFVLICTGVFAFVLTLAVIVPIAGREREVTHPDPRLNRLPIVVPIPPEEIFLPDEPDFVPGVMLGREQRTEWTEEDALEFWQDPLRYGEGQWRVLIESIVDELLERVP